MLLKCSKLNIRDRYIILHSKDKMSLFLLKVGNGVLCVLEVGKRFPGTIVFGISNPFNEVLRALITYPFVKYFLDFVFLMIINDEQLGEGVMSIELRVFVKSF